MIIEETHKYYSFKAAFGFAEPESIYLLLSRYLRGSTNNLIAVRSLPSIVMFEKAGMQIRSIPWGATKPLAMAIALMAWLSATAPTDCISAQWCS
jgi:hypothetical protein